MVGLPENLERSYSLSKKKLKKWLLHLPCLLFTFLALLIKVGDDTIHVLSFSAI